MKKKSYDLIDGDEKSPSSGEKLKKESAVKLAEIRRALELADEVRFSGSHNAAERAELERASVALRESERELIEEIGSEVAAAIKESSLTLEEMAKRIRARSTRLSKTAKGVDKVTKAILQLCQSLR
ncbi:MAG: hypothetical protein Q8R90_00225 [Bacteroidales bacterium]|nr:hypothetical protein [Bacteroidales bacterium]